MINKLKALAVAAVVAVTPIAAGAVTVVNDGDSVAISTGSDFIGDVDAFGGAGSFVVNFTSATDPLDATASATIGPVVAGTFTDLVMSWVSDATDAVLASVAVTDPGAALGTTFASPSDLVQRLEITWTDSLDGASFDIEVSAVPLPAGGFLLIGALGALGVARRRKS